MHHGHPLVGEEDQRALARPVVGLQVEGEPVRQQRLVVAIADAGHTPTHVDVELVGPPPRRLFIEGHARGDGIFDVIRGKEWHLVALDAFAQQGPPRRAQAAAHVIAAAEGRRLTVGGEDSFVMEQRLHVQPGEFRAVGPPVRSTHRGDDDRPEVHGLERRIEADVHAGKRPTDGHGHGIARPQARLTEVLDQHGGKIWIQAGQLGFQVAGGVGDQADFRPDQARARRVIDQIEAGVLQAAVLAHSSKGALGPGGGLQAQVIVPLLRRGARAIEHELHQQGRDGQQQQDEPAAIIQAPAQRACLHKL